MQGIGSGLVLSLAKRVQRRTPHSEQRRTKGPKKGREKVCEVPRQHKNLDLHHDARSWSELSSGYEPECNWLPQGWTADNRADNTRPIYCPVLICTNDDSFSGSETTCGLGRSQQDRMSRGQHNCVRVSRRTHRDSKRIYRVLKNTGETMSGAQTLKTRQKPGSS